ncbi:acyltransferase family protein [Legionella waltersii]|uniref:Acyltransferase n=1 Tax=Legionella waltersii TaxID=66969 RepID=A0A0W1ACX3_9GAMM|nr:acyltransferase family protein [Legionella waltersii]KTD79190.1 acyltransferase [Legionella waltersii]SNV12444.1 acyltransferase [Legionella waltersii]
MIYRPDIDGLRAVAIAFVLIFHSGLSFLPSGFIGVDVFFVISGFLITSIIHYSINNNQFSFKEFYSRRLWRLQPVFICLLVLTTLLALIYYLPDDLVLFSKSARKTTLFTSNVFFKNATNNYFSPDSNQLPLLHTWSLSIEWQCYFLLPFLVYGLQRIAGAKYACKAIGLLILVFFTLSLYFSVSNPAKTYYQLLSRLFEFFIGAWVATAKDSLVLNKRLIDGLAIIALLSLFYVAMSKEISSGFPNWYTLLVCCATAVLIIAGEQEKRPFITKLLSTRPFVFIGLISYSLYLWHWPIFAVSHYLNIKQTSALTITLLALVFIISYLSWRYIEKPTRTFYRMGFVNSCLLLLLFPLVITHGSDYVIRQHDGYPLRFKEAAGIYEVLNRYKNVQRPLCLQRKSIEVSEHCVLGAKNTKAQRGLMIGDSYSNQYWGFVDTLARDANLSVLSHATVACLALPTILQMDWFVTNSIYEECMQQKKRYYAMIKANHYDVVILAEHWNAYLRDNRLVSSDDFGAETDNRQLLSVALNEALQRIIDSGAKPVLIKSIAVSSKDNPYTCFYEHIKFRTKYNSENCDYQYDPKEQEWLDHLFASLQKKYKQLVVIDPKLVQCPQGLCKADIEGVPLFRDGDHINDYASYQWGDIYLKKFVNPLLG